MGTKKKFCIGARKPKVWGSIPHRDEKTSFSISSSKLTISHLSIYKQHSLLRLFHLFHTKKNRRCLGVASWLSQSFASCAAHGFCAYGPMNFVRNITWIEIEGNCIFETCWLRNHIKLPWNNIILLLRDIQVIWQWMRVFLRVSF